MGSKQPILEEEVVVEGLVGQASPPEALLASKTSREVIWYGPKFVGTHGGLPVSEM
jgi:hypothetical protein